MDGKCVEIIYTVMEKYNIDEEDQEEFLEDLRKSNINKCLNYVTKSLRN